MDFIPRAIFEDDIISKELNDEAMKGFDTMVYLKDTKCRYYTIRDVALLDGKFFHLIAIDYALNLLYLKDVTRHVTMSIKDK